MRILIIAVGSRGDVAPFTGLGRRLFAAGHQVTVATHDLFEPSIRGADLDFHPLPLDTREELTERLTAEGARGQLRTTVEFSRILAAHARPMAAAILDAARQADMLLLTPAGWIGTHVAEALSLPSMGVYLQPMTPTREFPPAMVTTRALGGRGNRWAASALLNLGQRPFRTAVAALRDDLGLPPIGTTAWLARLRASRWPICYGYSPTVVPQPADWPDWNHTAGYWWPAADPAFTPPPEVADFLAAGPPPVYIGFGSMPFADGTAVSALLLAALRKAGLRAVVNSGWAGLSGAGGDVLTVADLPHDWLFPRMAAVVHHAGAGTTAAGLRAGIPAVPVPFMVDQPFWARRLALLGVTPEPIPFRQLTADRLAAALTRATGDSRYRERATDIAARLAREDGAAAVLHVVNGSL
ncbi:glycosyltransferase [Actinoplanes utahensis]|uniref:Uncharacterized protein n=1 Tax=Actinoplanes utahensis TaxID=1869 RepID=A0A0A6UKN0_ACTUT|nr:glycosyltransferase [Actinoplanes utahensis]KHD74854.1 hypothetical protein MB27_26350 [Actinoplanes utahensis]GIF30769.1 hypothetical protein Aut01nite_37550 [Actinoplanes utahensis]